jgi:hypothetical protein
MSDSGVNVPVRVTMDDSQAKNELSVMGSGFNRLETSVISTARRTVSGFSTMLSSMNAVYDAQQRVNVATISYTLAVRQYGAGSIQASRALTELKVAQNGVAIANDRVLLSFAQFAMSVGPQMYSMIMKMLAASAGMTIQNYMETASWYAKAAAIGLTLGILSGGILVMTGLMSGAAVSNQITQNNTFNGTGTANPQNMADYTNNSLVNSLGSVSSP